jgi:hypothetical protein
MKFKLLMLTLLAFTFAACNSSNDANADCDKTEEGMACCKDAAVKGEKCAKCDHKEAGDSTCVGEKACCKEAKANGTACDHCAKDGSAKAACCPEGKSCDKCADGEKASCKEAKAAVTDCAKCAHS